MSLSATAGTTQPLPKYAPTSVARAVKSECAPYLELASAYSKSSDEAVNKVLASHGQTFHEVRALSTMLLLEQGCCGLTCYPSGATSPFLLYQA